VIEIKFKAETRELLWEQMASFLAELDQPDTVEETSTEEPSIEDLKKLVSQLAQADRQRAKDILSEFGATRLANVGREHHSRLHRVLSEAVTSG